MNENSKIYKISFYTGQSVLVIFVALILISLVFILYQFITWIISLGISILPIMFNKIQNTFLNPKWLNENQGVLSLIAIIIAMLPFVTQIITLQQLRIWRLEYNKKIDKVSTSIMITAMSLFRTRIDLKKYIENYSRNEVVVRPKIFRTYPVKYGIENKLEDESKNYFSIKINLLVILEYLDIINQQQSLLVFDRDNEYLRKQIENDMKYTLDKVNLALALMEVEIKKYEYQIKNWSFSKDPTFSSSFSEEELVVDLNLIK